MQDLQKPLSRCVLVQGEYPSHTILQTLNLTSITVVQYKPFLKLPSVPFRHHVEPSDLFFAYWDNHHF